MLTRASLWPKPRIKFCLSSTWNHPPLEYLLWWPTAALFFTRSQSYSGMGAHFLLQKHFLLLFTSFDQMDLVFLTHPCSIRQFFLTLLLMSTSRMLPFRAWVQSSSPFTPMQTLLPSLQVLLHNRMRLYSILELVESEFLVRFRKIQPIKSSLSGL